MAKKWEKVSEETRLKMIKNYIWTLWKKLPHSSDTKIKIWLWNK